MSEDLEQMRQAAERLRQQQLLEQQNQARMAAQAAASKEAARAAALAAAAKQPTTGAERTTTRVEALASQQAAQARNLVEQRQQAKAVTAVAPIMTPTKQLQATEASIASAENAIKVAESYTESWGSKITWGNETYDLGTTQGYKDYKQAIRDAKSDINKSKNEIKIYKSKKWEAETEKKAKAVVKEGAKITKKTEKIIKEQRLQQEKLREAEEKLAKARRGETKSLLPPFIVAAASTSRNQDIEKLAGVGLTQKDLKDRYVGAMETIQALSEYFYEKSRENTGEKYVKIKDIERDIKNENIPVLNPSTYGIAGTDPLKMASTLVGGIGYATTQMIIGSLGELTFPASWGVAEPKRGTDIGLRVVGGILTPSPIDYAVTALIKKLSLRKNGAKLINEVFFKEVPLEKRIGYSMSISDLLESERMTGVTNIRNMIKTVDLTGLTKLQGSKLFDDALENLAEFEKMKGSQKLTTDQLRKLGKSIDIIADNLSGAKYYDELKQFNKLGKEVQDMIAVSESGLDDIAHELDAFEKLKGSKYSVADLRNAAQNLGKNADDAIENASTIDNAMSALKGSDDWGTGVNLNLSKAEQEETVKQVTNQLVDLRKILNELGDIDPDSGMFTRFGMLTPGEKQRLLAKYKELVDFWEKNPDLFTAGAAVKPSSASQWANVEDFLIEYGWEPDDYVNFIDTNGKIIPVGVLTLMLNDLNKPTDKVVPKDELKEYKEPKMDQYELPIPFSVPDVTEITEPVIEQPPGEEETPIVEPIEEQEPIGTPIQEPVQEPIPDMPPEPEPTEEPPRGPLGRFIKQPKERKLKAMGLKSGKKMRFRVVFTFPRRIRETLKVPADNYVSALQLAQRARKPRRDLPTEVNIWPL